jgi:hypothetical protein
VQSTSLYLLAKCLEPIKTSHFLQFSASSCNLKTTHKPRQHGQRDVPNAVSFSPYYSCSSLPPLIPHFLIISHSLISTIGICERQFWPKSTELQLDRIKGLYAPYYYSSIPEEGMPRLPFKDNAVRKATEEPFFQWVYEAEVATEVEEPLVLTSEEMKNGKLIGVQPQ